MVGKWTAKDSIRFASREVNLYRYVVNDPVNLLDPLGLAPSRSCPINPDSNVDYLTQLIDDTAIHIIGFASKEVNLYGYVVNDPVNLLDPLGLAPSRSCPINPDQYFQRC